MGALNATATPAATPAVTKSRLSLGLRKRRNVLVVNPSVVECPCDSAAPSAAPMWMSGPSGPTGSPLATARPQEMTLTTTVAMLNTWRGAVRAVRGGGAGGGRGVKGAGWGVALGRTWPPAGATKPRPRAQQRAPRTLGIITPLR